MVLYVKIIKKLKRKGEEKNMHLNVGINKLKKKKIWVIKDIYHSIKLEGVRSLFKKTRLKMSFKNVNWKTRS